MPKIAHICAALVENNVFPCHSSKLHEQRASTIFGPLDVETFLLDGSGRSYKAFAWETSVYPTACEL